MKTTCCELAFECPECHSSHFGCVRGTVTCHDEFGMGCMWQGDECDKWMWTTLVTKLEPESGADMRKLDQQAKRWIARYIGAAAPAAEPKIPTVAPDTRRRHTVVGPAVTRYNVSPDECVLLVETDPERDSMDVVLYSHLDHLNRLVVVKDSTGHADRSPIHVFDHRGGVVLDVPYAAVQLEAGEDGWLIDGEEPLRIGWVRSSQRS